MSTCQFRASRLLCALTSLTTLSGLPCSRGSQRSPITGSAQTYKRSITPTSGTPNGKASKRLSRKNRFGAAILLVAETAAFSSPDFPILVVDTLRDRIPFRCIAAELWAVENNLNLASMDWQDFTTSADQDEVFRGFSSPATLLRQ